MSLINQMLADLERRTTHAAAGKDEVLCGLRSASVATNPRGRMLRYVSSMLIAAVAFAWVGGHWWQAFDGNAEATRARTSISLSLPPYPSLAARDREPPVAAALTPEPGDVLPRTLEPSADDNVVHPVEPHAYSPSLVRAALAADSGDLAATEPVLAPTHAAFDSASVREKGTGDLVRTPVVLTDAERAERAYGRALRRLHLGDAHGADHALKEALNLSPDYLPARELLLVRLMGERRWAQAVSVVEAGLEVTPGNIRLLMFHARILAEQDRAANALEVLESSSPSLNQYPDYYVLQAALSQRTGAHGKAVDLYRRLVAKRPDSSLWWMGMGISLEALGDSDNAREAYQRATRAGSLSPEARRFVGGRLSDFGN